MVVHPPPGHHFNLEAPGEFTFSLDPPSSFSFWDSSTVAEHEARTLVHIEPVDPSNSSSSSTSPTRVLVTLTHFLCTDDLSNCFPPAEVLFEFEIRPAAAAAAADDNDEGSPKVVTDYTLSL